MPKLKLHMRTFSPAINFSCNAQRMFIQKRNKVYFLDTKKLDKILSLMRILGKFNEYCNSSDTNNITDWIQEKRLFSPELIEEITIAQREVNSKEKINKITSFSEDYSSANVTFGRFFRENIFNIAAFNYIKTNENKINSYVGAMLDFFRKNKLLEYKKYPFQFFMNCLFEAEKAKMFNEITADTRYELACYYNRDISNCFNIEKITDKYTVFFYECLKPESFLEFEVFYNSDNKIFGNIDKYLQISEFMTDIRIKEEHKHLIAISSKPKQNWAQKEDGGIFLRTNMCIMNLNQIFYLCLNDENKENLNALLPYSAEDFIFYYKNTDKNTLSSINYASIKKEN